MYSLPGHVYLHLTWAILDCSVQNFSTSSLVMQKADAATMPHCTLSHTAQHLVQLSLQAGDPARPEEVEGDTSGSEMEEEPAGKRVRTCALRCCAALRHAARTAL